MSGRWGRVALLGFSVAGLDAGCKDTCSDTSAEIAPNGRLGVLWYEPALLPVQDGMRATLLLPKYVEQQRKGDTKTVYIPSIDVSRPDGGSYVDGTEVDVRKQTDACPDRALQTWSYEFSGLNIEGEGHGSHVFVSATPAASGIEVVVQCDMTRVSNPKTDWLKFDPSFVTVRLSDSGRERYTDELRVRCLRGTSVRYSSITRSDGTSVPPKGVVRVGEELALELSISAPDPLGGTGPSEVTLLGEGLVSSDGNLEIVAQPRTTSQGRARRAFRVRALKPSVRPTLRAGTLEGPVDIEIQ